MKKSFPRKIVYYRSETEDFVALAEKSHIKIDEAYKYKRTSPLQIIGDFIAYRLIATPCAYLFTKHKLHERILGKEKLRAYVREQKKARRLSKAASTRDKSEVSDKFPHTGSGYFIYSNHTQQIADAFTPNIIAFPKKNSVIIDKNNLSLPLLGRHLKRLGGMPLPEDMKAARHFTDEVARRIGRGECVTVYPEAHVWEFFTGVRSFQNSAMDLPVRCSAPVFCATRVYKQKRRGRVACDIYIDGPFYPDRALSKKEARDALRDEVYSAMCERAKLSSVEVIKYIKVNEETENFDSAQSE